ncbi:MAG: hypothetical protein IJ479_08030 [Alphaproteobacteria bacterium]|nr:hypothetical protein [Alphaproteobacteria bacterium]
MKINVFSDFFGSGKVRIFSGEDDKSALVAEKVSDVSVILQMLRQEDEENAKKCSDF